MLFGVYEQAYYLRLIEVLGTDFEKVSAYLGEAEFARAATAYIKACPSKTANARWFGRRFPEFLHTTPPYSKAPEIGELALFEQALANAFDAEDTPPVTLDDLAKLPPEDWQRLIFSPHPSVQRLNLQTNAIEIWQALHSDDTQPPPAAEKLPEPAAVIVYRQALKSMFRSLAPEEAMMWDEAAKQADFATLCHLVATFGGEDGAAMRAASYLKGWIEAELLEQNPIT